jgi:DNA-binding transcriptional ArsR family regulator
MAHISTSRKEISQLSAEGELALYLRLLGEENRLRIFSLLARSEMCVCEIEDATGLSQSLVSNHLAVLRNAGLVESRRDDEDGRWIFYRGDREAAEALRERLDVLLNVCIAPGDRHRAEVACRLKGRQE